MIQTYREDYWMNKGIFHIVFTILTVYKTVDSKLKEFVQTMCTSLIAPILLITFLKFLLLHYIFWITFSLTDLFLNFI